MDRFPHCKPSGFDGQGRKLIPTTAELVRLGFERHAALLFPPEKNSEGISGYCLVCHVSVGILDRDDDGNVLEDVVDKIIPFSNDPTN